MKEYIVKVEIEHSGTTMESDIEVEAYNEEEANTIAESKALDNLLILGRNITENIQEENADIMSEYEIEISIELYGYNINSSIFVDAYKEEEAISEAEEKSLNNIIINSINTEIAYSD